MTQIPKEMMQNGRAEDQAFALDEQLFRRFSPEMAEGSLINLDAIEMPDMSVNRQKYSRPEWALISNSETQDFSDWGVAVFKIEDIPKELMEKGQFVFRFSAVHAPIKSNYSHTEVRAFENGLRIKKPLDPSVHLRFRKRLAQRIRIVVQPNYPE